MTESRVAITVSRRAVVTAAGSLAALPLLAACGGTTAAASTSTASVSAAASTTARETGSTIATAAPSAPAAATGHVDFYQVYVDSAALPKISALIKQQYPNLDVNYLSFANNQDVATKLTAAVAGGTPPAGVYETAPFWNDIQPFLMPLDDLISRDSKLVQPDDFVPVGLQATRKGGKVYGLPMEIAVRGWWFNRQLLAEHNVPLPVGGTAPAKMTLQQLQDMGQKLTTGSASNQTYGLFVDRTWYEDLIYVYGFGGRFLDENHTQCLLDSPEAIAGLQRANDLVVQNKLGPASGGFVNYAKTNSVAMALGNAALAQNLKLLTNGKDWDTGPVVAGPVAPMSYAFVHAGGVVQGTSNPEAGWIALTAYTGKDAEAFWMDDRGWPTARQSYLDLWIKNGNEPPTTRQNVLAWAKATSLVTFPHGYNGKIAPVLTQAMQSAMLGKLTVQDAARQAAQQVTALLKGG